MLDVFRGSQPMTFNLQSKFYMCAWALIAYILNLSTRILQGNSWPEWSGLKIFAHCVAERLFDASKVVFMFNNSQIDSEVCIVTVLSRYNPTLLSSIVTVLSW